MTDQPVNPPSPSDSDDAIDDAALTHGRALIAYHQAGRVIADIVFGHDTGPVTIEHDGDAADPGSSLLDSISADEDEKAYQVIFERFVMWALAGGIAQWRFDPASVKHVVCENRDRIWAEKGLDELDTPTHEIYKAYRHLLVLRTQFLIEKHWDAVIRIANFLIKRGTLTRRRRATPSPSRDSSRTRRWRLAAVSLAHVKD